MGSPGEPILPPTARKRLHITPFNPTLYDRFVPPTLQPLASDISFHTVQTFPDRGYGYVELPAMEADKLRKKLNGTTLKGTKVRIEEAKPEKKRKANAEADNAAEDVPVKERKRKKTEDGVLPGHQLEGGRRVKRGWTEDGAAKKKKANKDDAGIESRRVRFKTTVPPNALPVSDRPKKVKDKKKASAGETKAVVEEFAKTRKAAEMPDQSNNAKRTASFEDGKGWVDEDGDVVEAAPKSSRPKRRRKDIVEDADVAEPILAPENGAMQRDVQIHDDAAHETADSQADTVAPLPAARVDEDTATSNGVQRESSEQAQALDRDTLTTEAVNATKEVHPLEALFKRSVPTPESVTKPKPAPIDTSFSFFDPEDVNDDDAEGTEPNPIPPQTPFTQQDMEWRSIRSAAPTPDTAAIGKRFSFAMADRDDGDDGDEDDEDDEDDVIDEGNADRGGDRGDAATGGGMLDSKGSPREVQNGGREESEFPAHHPIDSNIGSAASLATIRLPSAAVWRNAAKSTLLTAAILNEQTSPTGDTIKIEMDVRHPISRYHSHHGFNAKLAAAEGNRHLRASQQKMVRYLALALALSIISLVLSVALTAHYGIAIQYQGSDHLLVAWITVSAALVWFAGLMLFYSIRRQSKVRSLIAAVAERENEQELQPRRPRTNSMVDADGTTAPSLERLSFAIGSPFPIAHINARGRNVSQEATYGSAPAPAVPQQLPSPYRGSQGSYATSPKSSISGLTTLFTAHIIPDSPLQHPEPLASAPVRSPPFSQVASPRIPPPAFTRHRNEHIRLSYDSSHYSPKSRASLSSITEITERMAEDPFSGPNELRSVSKIDLTDWQRVSVKAVEVDVVKPVQPMVQVMRDDGVKMLRDASFRRVGQAM
ncbi:hypothetical protein BAUCODRAFT_133599 [Baudoinia panamericana UAMH 10762]|uniref:RRM domain-containing protein n=1 Tax=Baudoinia panamericana (strain UAMH 10762) TaxID=717646 RepID=M2LF16_BAUPA|nr:uncharacterized protein BAUCODRAFT_133599 [Baudoinia panamericana UAMH 10762]EMC92617.1 hypothetical protein BAUCODRAFT_133599 [Baudoinia panamericana UAMH 10762]